MRRISLPLPLQRLGSLLGATLVIVGGSAAVVWPVWFLATHRRSDFNLAIGLLAAFMVALGAARAIRRRLRRRRRSPSPTVE